MSKNFDVIVIGGGPGGYVASIRCAQLGFKVACIENWKNKKGDMALGGTCLNVGCIPSKALLASSEEFEKIKYYASDHGISVSGVNVDLLKMHTRKEKIVKKMTGGIEYLFRKNKISWIKGRGSFAERKDSNYRILVEGDTVEFFSATYVIIATGSKARQLSTIPVDNFQICDNEGALSFESIPQRLGIIGAGVIGLELGSVWRRLGSEVTLLEGSPTFLPSVDFSIAKEAQERFTKQGLDIKLGIKIIEVKKENDVVSVLYQDKGGDTNTIFVDRLIISIGRIPNTDGLGLGNVGIEINKSGFIEVDMHCRTSAPNVFAIGDVVRGPMLAHKAEDEGVLVAEIIDGQKPHIDYNCIPWVIYTSPEIAWVGKTEQQLKSEKREVRIGQFPFLANGRALGLNAPEGFIKIVADACTDEILGVHIISAGASEIISEAVVAMEFKAASEDISRICHPHPSLSEVMREAALAVDKRAINI